MAIIKKELSAGILFFNHEGSLFMARATGLTLRNGCSKWDIPKGHVEPGETPLRAAIRECQEETGFIDYDASLLVDLGEHKYSSGKNLHLFTYPFPIETEAFRNCKCTAFFEDYVSGEMIPEMDRFALIKKQMWEHVMGYSLFKVMDKLYPSKVEDLEDADWEC